MGLLTGLKGRARWVALRRHRHDVYCAVLYGYMEGKYSVNDVIIRAKKLKEVSG